MTGISGPRGSGGSNRPLLDEGGKPFERRIWELAIARIAQSFMDSDRAPSDLESVKLVASQTLSDRDTSRLNRLIEQLWSETVAQPSSSKDSPIESVYYHAVSRFSERLEIPPMQGPSLLLEQAWLLTRAADLGGETDSLMETVANELQQKMDDSAASRLRALALDPTASAASLRRLLQMVGNLVSADPMPVDELRALVDQPSVTRALQRGVRVHTAQLLRRMDGEVTQAIDGVQMAQMPGGVTLEKREEFKRHWGTLRDQVEHNRPFKTRNKVLTEADRALLYNFYLTRLKEAWEHFKQEEPWRMLETLSDFLEVCETGWDQQISQLIEQIPGRAPVMLQPLVQACAERRGELEKQRSDSGLGTNVHYERALRQLLNNRLALGFSPEQLGDAESDEVQHMVQRTAQKIVEVVDSKDPDERAQRSQQRMHQSWTTLGEAEQEQVQQAIRELWQDALGHGAEPYFLAAEDLKRIKQYQEDVKWALAGQASGAHAGQRLAQLLPSAPLSVTELPLLDGELEPLHAALQASDWERFYKLVDNLVQHAELRAFDNAVSGSRRAEVLQALWAGALGLGSFDDLAFQRLCESLVPEDVSAEVQRVREEEARSMEAAQIREWMGLLSRNGIQGVPERAWQNRDFVLAAVQWSTQTLRYAAEELRADPGFIFLVVQRNYQSLAFAAAELRGDQAFMLDVLQYSPYAIEYASEELKKNREFIREAVQRSPVALGAAAQDLRADREIVLNAVRRDGLALKYAAYPLRLDREIVLAAVKGDDYALQFAADELRADRQIVLAAVERAGLALQFAADELRADRQIVRAAVERAGLALQFAADELRADQEIVLAAVRQNGRALRDAAEALQAKFEIVLAAVQQNPRAIQYAADSLRSHPEILRAAEQ